MKQRTIMITVVAVFSLIALTTVGFAQRRVSAKTPTKGKVSKAQALKLNKKLNKGGTVSTSPSTSQIKKAHPQVMNPAQPEFKVSFGATKLVAKNLEIDESRLKKLARPKLDGSKTVLSSGTSVYVVSMHNINKYNYVKDRRVNRYASSMGKEATVSIRLKNLSPNTSYLVQCKPSPEKTGKLAAIYKNPNTVSFGTGAFAAVGKGTVAGILTPPHKERNANILWSTKSFRAGTLAPCRVIEIIMP